MYQAILLEQERLGSNICLKRLSIDIFLPGLMTLKQVRAVVSDDGKTCHFRYCLQETYLSANRTAVCVAGTTFGRAAAPTHVVRETMGVAAWVQVHRMVLERIDPEQQENIYHISLPFEVDRAFCRRDDWGRDKGTHRMEMGVYRHENPDMQAQNPCVWIIQNELSAREHPMADPLSPRGFGVWSDYA